MIATSDLFSAIGWLLGEDTGISSKTILAVMVGQDIKGYLLGNTPQDGADFGRCHRLLRLFPDFRGRLPEVVERFPEWAPMVREWDGLTGLYLEVLAADWPKGPLQSKLYSRMQELIEEGRLLDGWKKTGPTSYVRTK